MVPLQSVGLKMEHTARRLNELHKEVVEFLETHPVGFVETADSTPEQTQHRILPTRPVPFRIGLACGDVLQNLRSTLDYLIYELVAVNGAKPNRKHMFPIAMDEERYQRDIEMNNKIKGVHPRAAVFIEALQPFLLAEPKKSALFVLDELTNLNKHRQPLLTAIRGSNRDLVCNFPRLPVFVEGSMTPGSPTKEITTSIWVVMSDEPVVNLEITSLMKMLFDYVGDEVLPLFKEFFE